MNFFRLDISSFQPSSGSPGMAYRLIPFTLRIPGIVSFRFVKFQLKTRKKRCLTVKSRQFNDNSVRSIQLNNVDFCEI